MNFDKLHSYQSSLISFGLSGTDIGVYVDGKSIYREAVGYRDIKNRKKFDENTLFAMYSMTKPITCSSALSLYEEGRFLMSDPLSDFLPEFSEMKVKNKATNETEKAKKAVTMHHLFTMTGGFNYNYQSDSLKKALQENPDFNNRDLARALAAEPLDFEPGTHFQYSLGHDVLAAAIESMEGKRLSEIMRERIFEPLGIKSAVFHPNAEQNENLALTYAFEQGKTAETELCVDELPLFSSKEYESGGGGLHMTLDDYARFANTLCMGGKSPDTGKRILSSGIVRAMAENQLSEFPLKDFRENPARAGYGYGLGVRTLMSPAESVSAGEKGEFGWSGMAGTYLLIDPEKKLVIVYCQSALPAANHIIHRRVRNLVYAALER